MPFCYECGKKETVKRVSTNNRCNDCSIIGDNKNTEGTTADNNECTITVNTDYWNTFDKRLDSKIGDLEQKMNNVIATQGHKITLLEKKCETYEENIEALKSIVAKQQRTLGNIDNVERDRNIIISGLSEEKITINDVTYEKDEQKIEALFKIIGIPLPQGYIIMRLGKANEKFHRTMKVNVISKDNRDAIMKTTNKLKGADAPWNNIYIKKDLHPALVQENHRLRIKKKKLLQLDG